MTFRNNKVHDWQIEGIGFGKATATNLNWYIYGNQFYGQTNGSATCFWNFSTGTSGPVYLYNNTFFGVTITSTQGSSQQFGNGSISRNNIFYNSAFDSVSYFADADYNLSNAANNNGFTLTGTHTHGTAGACPFQNGCVTGATDFRIKDTVNTGYPKNAGTALNSTFGVDLAGTTRGAGYMGDDPLHWDIGSLENTNTNTLAPTVSPWLKLIFPKLWP